MVDKVEKRFRKTTETSLEIIEAMAEQEWCTLSSLTEEFDFSKSTIHSHLRTLMRKDYVVKKGNTYELSFKFFNIGEQTRGREEVYRFARRKALELSRETGYEGGFAVHENGKAIILFEESSAPAIDGFQVGNYFYMHNTAVGKAMLAEMPKQRVVEIIDRHGLPSKTPNTITEMDELFEELEVTRKKGYATSNEESVEGLRAISVAVRYPNGDIFGALDISGPAYRLSSDEQPIYNRLKIKGQELEEELETQLAVG